VLLGADNEEFSCYNRVYDQKYGYYDEYQYMGKSRKQAVADVLAYVKAGVSMTYGVVTEQNAFAEEITDTTINYGKEAIVFSAAKIGETLVENFIGEG
ncbi:MAG: hypothetical protein RR415_05685, partial [Ruthenibacterium sp.]